MIHINVKLPGIEEQDIQNRINVRPSPADPFGLLVTWDFRDLLFPHYHKNTIVNEVFTHRAGFDKKHEIPISFPLKRRTASSIDLVYFLTDLDFVEVSIKMDKREIISIIIDDPEDILFNSNGLQKGEQEFQIGPPEHPQNDLRSFGEEEFYKFYPNKRIGGHEILYSLN